MDDSGKPQIHPRPINATQDLATAGPNYIFQTPAQGVARTITLTAPATAAATTFVLSNSTGIQAGMGICITPLTGSCNMTMSAAMSLSAGEVALVTAVNGLNVTVARGSIGTAGAYSTAQPITVLRSGSYSQFAANVVKDFDSSIIANPQYGSASSQTSLLSIQAAQTAIQAAQAALAANATLPH